jgi:integrase
MDIVAALEVRGVGVKSTTNGIVHTTTAHGRLVFDMFAGQTGRERPRLPVPHRHTTGAGQPPPKLGPHQEGRRLGDLRFHDIRQTCVSLLPDLGVSPHSVRDIVGHSDFEVTMTIYAHAALDEKRKVLRKLGEALG